jgi:uncharacterized protein (TIGR03435 family)
VDHRITRRAALMLLAARQAISGSPSFKVVSFKHTGNMNDGARIESGRKYYRPRRRLEYKGLKLSGEEILVSFLQFAFSPLIHPWQFRGYPWMNAEYYEIRAIAPAGTALDDARAMFRSALTERLALQYHLDERETPVYFLTQNSGPLKLPPASAPETNPGGMQMGKYVRKPASMEDFATWLPGLTGRAVVDHTNVRAQFRFDVDGRRQMQESMQTFGPGGDPGVALMEVEKLGLQLEAGKERRSLMVVDHLNRTPAPN